MLNVIASNVFDIAGYVELDVLPGNNSGNTRRRVSRIATLDGGAVVNDAGYSETDRTIELVWQSRDKITDDAIARLVQTYTRVTVATRDGVYLASPELFTPGAAEAKLSLLIVSKLSQ